MRKFFVSLFFAGVMALSASAAELPKIATLPDGTEIAIPAIPERSVPEFRSLTVLREGKVKIIITALTWITPRGAEERESEKPRADDVILGRSVFYNFLVTYALD